MDLLFWLLLIGLIGIFGLRLMPLKGIGSINTSELKQLINDKNKQFIDVRTPGEYQSYHIKQFMNFPLHKLAANKQRLDPNKETILICQSGMRSMQTAKIKKDWISKFDKC